MKIIRYAILDMETLTWVAEESYEYKGPIDKCCGPGHQEVAQAANQENFATQLQQNYAQRFAGQNQTIGNLNQILQGIQNGQMLPGFGPQTMATLNSQAIDTTAGNFKNAQIAANNENAGRGGDSGLQPGTVGQENATIASNAAGQLSSEEQNIQLANQAQSVQNTQTALGGYGALAGIKNPLGFAGAGTSANAQAFNEANQISGMYNQGEAALAGGITGLAGSVLGIPAVSNLMNPSSSGTANFSLPPSALGIDTQEQAPGQQLQEPS